MFSLILTRHQSSHRVVCIENVVVCVLLPQHYLLCGQGSCWYLVHLPNSIHIGISTSVVQSLVSEDKNRSLVAAMQMLDFKSKTTAVKRAFLFFNFWQAFSPWLRSPCPLAPPPHSTEMDTENFCLRPALATEPTRRETACALKSKIFMSCFG